MVGDIEDVGGRKPLAPLNHAVTTKRKLSEDDEIGKNWREVRIFFL